MNAIAFSAFVVAWMLGEATASFVDTMTGAMSTSTYRADVNLDRVFDETDTMAGYKTEGQWHSFLERYDSLAPGITDEIE